MSKRNLTSQYANKIPSTTTSQCSPANMAQFTQFNVPTESQQKPINTPRKCWYKPTNKPPNCSDKINLIKATPLSRPNQCETTKMSPRAVYVNSQTSPTASQCKLTAKFPSPPPMTSQCNPAKKPFGLASQYEPTNSPPPTRPSQCEPTSNRLPLTSQCAA